MKKQLLTFLVIFLSGVLLAQKPPTRKVTHNTTQANQGGREQDTVPVVKAVNTINSNAIVKLPLVASIPAEAFRPTNENGNNGYYKIRRDGLGTLAGTGEKINNSLVAPLNLPNGAVITKINFNILSLYPHRYFPHLRLIQRGIVNSDRQNGAYMGNTPITKYSVSSMGMNTESGLLDIKTVVTDGLNYKINNKGSSYFFEVLANQSDNPPVDTRGSFWPNDNYLFIWSIEVYYTLP